MFIYLVFAGVSNFGIQHLEELFSWNGLTVQPMVNQVQIHTRLAQQPLVEYCQQRNIVVTAFCPLSESDLSAKPLHDAAAAHGVSPAAVVLRWLLQRGIVAIQKSSNREKLKENVSTPRGWSLTSDEMSAINALDKDFRMRAGSR